MAIQARLFGKAHFADGRSRLSGEDETAAAENHKQGDSHFFSVHMCHSHR
jgi:hypothetical protein